MQTFLPTPNFQATAEILDYRRLGKQRIEVLQIAHAITGQSKGWANHPATVMWRDSLPALIAYGVACCDEWIRRGYVDTTRSKLLAIQTPQLVMPWWLGMEEFHSAHRAALLHKNFDYYSQFGWTESPRLEYVWPITQGK